ncbi:MAG: nuclease ue [Candidatus Parcubacteria bacterium]
MKKSIGFAIAMMAFVLFLPNASHAATVADAESGKILLDVSSHGEAWYVNPQSRMRVYLGRPAEALDRLRERAAFVSFDNISRLSDDAAKPCEDAAYAKAESGLVLAPDDVIGAAWYVDPATGIRRRLATPADAWEVMRQGIPATKATLKAIPIEGEASAPKTEVARVKAVTSAGTLELADGRNVRILSVDTPSNPELQEAAVAEIRGLVKGGTVLLERDVTAKDADGTLRRHVHAGAANLGYELVRNGLAFHDIRFPDYKYAELYIVGSIDAARLKRGFWDNPSNNK